LRAVRDLRQSARLAQSHNPVVINCSTVGLGTHVDAGIESSTADLKKWNVTWWRSERFGGCNRRRQFQRDSHQRAKRHTILTSGLLRTERSPSRFVSGVSDEERNERKKGRKPWLSSIYAPYSSRRFVSVSSCRRGPPGRVVHTLPHPDEVVSSLASSVHSTGPAHRRRGSGPSRRSGLIGPSPARLGNAGDSNADSDSDATPTPTLSPSRLPRPRTMSASPAPSSRYPGLAVSPPPSVWGLSTEISAPIASHIPVPPPRPPSSLPDLTHTSSSATPSRSSTPASGPAGLTPSNSLRRRARASDPHTTSPVPVPISASPANGSHPLATGYGSSPEAGPSDVSRPTLLRLTSETERRLEDAGLSSAREGREGSERGPGSARGKRSSEDKARRSDEAGEVEVLIHQASWVSSWVCRGSSSPGQSE
jgi:hypothetical protein